MFNLWINYAIAFVSLFIALMSWFKIGPADIVRAIRKGAVGIRNVLVNGLSIVVMFVGQGVIAYGIYYEFRAGGFALGNLAPLIISIFAFFLALGGNLYAILRTVVRKRKR